MYKRQVLRPADLASLATIARRRVQLVQAASASRLAPEDLADGTFTLTNLGPLKVDAFTPVINPPEACILGLNAVADRPVAIGGQVVVRPMTTLSLSADHRILDGAEAARFLARIRELVENPWLLLL